MENIKIIRYSVLSRDRIFVKGYEFLKKNIGKTISKKLSGKYIHEPDHTKQSGFDTFKTASKKKFKKQQKQLATWLVIKVLTKSLNFQKMYNKIIQIQLQIRMIKKRQENFDDLRLNNNKIMEYQKTAEPTGDLIGNKIDVKFTKVSRSSPQNNSEAITNNHEKEIPKERYISPKEVQKIDLK